MLISIIIPFYRGKEYLHNMLKQLEMNSINLKTLGEDKKMEVIFVNDDPNNKIKIENNNYSFDIIIYDNIKNCGIQKSRINGFYQSKGEFILFLDQDDIISDFCIKKQVENVLNNNLDMSISNCIDGYPFKNKIVYRNKKYFNECYNIDSIIRYRNMIVSPGQCLIKKDTIPNEWLENILKNNGADDFLLWLIYFNKKNKVGILEQNLYVHVQTKKNFSNDIDKMYISSKEAIDLAVKKNFLKENQKKDIYKYFSLSWDHLRRNKIKRLIFIISHPIYVIDVLKYRLLNMKLEYKSIIYDEKNE